MSDNRLLNAILRTHFSPADYNLLNPAAAPPVEIDHFFEVQHIADIIVPLLGPNWYDVPIGEFLDLSSFVNEHRNMFQITRADNQEKKNRERHPLDRYPVDPFIRRYLDKRLRSGITVRESVRPLAEAMRDRVSAHSRLTRHAGRVLCDLMGW